MPLNSKINEQQQNELLKILENRFRKNIKRHPKMEWGKVSAKLSAHPKKLIALMQMEESGGEPDVVSFNPKTDEYLFVDCAPESPKGRRSLCYDHEAWLSRKEHKPKSSAVAMAEEMGVSLLTEEQYQWLQTLGNFDAKTSNWLATPEKLRKLGGALFGDYRFGRVFIYHNGAESYYAARGFRAALWV